MPKTAAINLIFGFLLLFAFYSKAASIGKKDSSVIIKTPNGAVLQSTLTQNGTHVSNIVVEITATDGNTFILDLYLNKFLIAYGYKEKVITHNDSYYLNFNQSSDYCYYIGIVRNVPDSSASLSTCGGITGYFLANKTTYSIFPDPSSEVAGSLVQNDSGEMYNFTCGVNDAVHQAPTSARKTKRSATSTDSNEIRTVELYIASDVTHQTLWGGVENVTKRIRKIVNIANGLYNAVGVRLVLVGMEIWTVSKISVTSFSNDTLNEWYLYKGSKLNNMVPSHDNACIFLGDVNFSDGVGGLGKIDTMCNSDLSGAFVKDIGLIVVAANVLVHEMGHNFGLNHDTTSCPCDDSSGKCIMAPTYSLRDPSVRFSSCSKEELIEKWNRGTDMCLFNTPKIIDMTVCGNGVLEDGEECDCGNLPSSQCGQSCCDRTTCKLVKPATCASGSCCSLDTCQINAENVLCRDVQGPCDLPEVCNGLSAQCPNDTYKHDGVPCIASDSDAYCYNGKCQNHETQCETLWEAGVESSSNTCYSIVNKFVGHSYGGCGETLGWKNSYTPCTANNVMCGQLLCSPSNGSHITTLMYQSIWYVTSLSCNTTVAVVNFGYQVPSPGFVPNGAKCGSDSMCIDDQCVKVNNVLADKSCSSECLNGICNNLGECQCLNGLRYPDCNPSPTTDAAATTSITDSTVSIPNSNTDSIPALAALPTTVKNIRLMVFAGALSFLFLV